MDRKIPFCAITVLLLLLLTCSLPVSADLLIGKKVRASETGEETYQSGRDVFGRLRPRPLDGIALPLQREHPWSLPKRALTADEAVELKVLILRFNFQPDDDPRSTGDGTIDVSTPVQDMGESAYLAEVGHLVDPPPHDAEYFHAHLRALSHYWKQVSEEKILIDTNLYIWPPGKDSAYQLSQPMSYYGACNFDSVVLGLERYFEECITIADTMSPEIEFSDYQSIFLIHAGRDAQNDIANNSCQDLYCGFIRYYRPIEVDSGRNTVQTALLLPEAIWQDGRATALNGTLAHEFGHQLGAVDLYSTANFATILGDFALYDHNGNSTGINLRDHGFTSDVFNAWPVYPSAWTRAYLGFVEVEEVRRGSDVHLVAAEVASSDMPKIIKVPISETEYYLIENRVVEFDGVEGPWFDAADGAEVQTWVIKGPGKRNPDLSISLTRDYDFLIPGGGVLIYRVDEEVAAMDYVPLESVNDTIYGDDANNFDRNTLQWDPTRKFVTLIEADGVENLSGYCRAGCGLPFQTFGWQGDMFREDLANRFTAETNPATLDHNRANTRIRIENIRRDTLPGGKFPIDTLIKLDIGRDDMVENFPVRVGVQSADSNQVNLSPIADDLDGDGVLEIITAVGGDLVVATAEGGNFLHQYIGCSPCSTYYDTVRPVYDPDSAWEHLVPITTVYEMPLYARVNGAFTAGPVTGDFGEGYPRRIAVGYKTTVSTGEIAIYELIDENNDGQADRIMAQPVQGIPTSIVFGKNLHLLTDKGFLYSMTDASGFSGPPWSLGTDGHHGFARIGDDMLFMADSLTFSRLYYFPEGESPFYYKLFGSHDFGPVVADLNLDELPEVVVASSDGLLKYVQIDTTQADPIFTVIQSQSTGYTFTTDPVIGDVDLDGYPDVIIGGINAVYAFDRNLILKSNFPIEVDDRHPLAAVSGASICADIRTGGLPEIIFPTDAGNLYSFGVDRSLYFPLSAGSGGVGSPVAFSSGGGRLGYIGADGWFYLWQTDALSDADIHWPMAGYDPSGSGAFSKEMSPVARANELLPKEKFYCWPNPVTEGTTTLRYTLGEVANSVRLTIYDLSGTEISSLTGTTHEDVNEFPWECDDVTPGVYRCIIEADFGDQTEHAFMDIAIIR